jgi:capsular polysaccharide biosynthesis protein
MIINNHILKISNVYYDNEFIFSKQPCKNINEFLDDDYHVGNYKNISDKKIITLDNTFVIETLHSCFSHAVIDCIFPAFWAINDIKNQDVNLTDILLFIRKKNIYKFRKQNLSLIDNNIGKYKGVHHDLISLLTDKYTFEHLIDNKTIYFIKNCYFYILNDKWQRSPWNCQNYYPGRNINLNNIIYTDDKIYYQLKQFVSSIKNKYNISTDNVVTYYKTIIIERKRNRFFDKKIINKIIENIQKNNSLKFNGIKILEDMTLHQQIKLFSENKVFIFRHGSCLANLIWIPKNSIIFDLDIQSNRKEIVNRLAKLTDSKVFSMLYTNIDYTVFNRL